MARQALASPGEVAAYLGRTIKTLAEWRYRGVGPRYRKIGSGASGKGGCVRYDWQDVYSWVDEQPAGGGEAA
jgi:hypothetical protein